MVVNRRAQYVRTGCGREWEYGCIRQILYWVCVVRVNFILFVLFLIVLRTHRERGL